MYDIKLKQIAHIENDFHEKFGIPRQSGIFTNTLESYIVFEEDYRNPDFIRGIQDFSHLWLIWCFSESIRENVSPTVRPPKLGGNKRVGVFATRAPYRPNPLGLSCVELLRVEETLNNGRVLVVSGADLINNTPIYDIKPYLPFSDCKIDATGGFTQETKDKTVDVVFPDELISLIPKQKHKGIIAILAQDPRPGYHDDANRIYGMRFSHFNIKFTVENDVLTVVDVTDEE